MPPDSEIAVSTLTSFLDDFLVNVFNPQLDDTINELCSQVFSESNAFQQDPQWKEKATTPIYKGASQFLALIKAFCKMIDNIPQDQALTLVIVSQLEAYYQTCNSWYKAMVMRPEGEDSNRPKLAAAKLEGGGDKAGVVKAIWEGDESDKQRLMEKEVEMIMDQASDKPFDALDIISDRRSGTALCLLYSTMQWLTSQLSQLRNVVKKRDKSAPDSERGQKTNRWTMVSSANMRDDDQPVKLTMTEDTAG